MSKNTDLGNLVNGLFVSSTRNVGIGMTAPANAVVIDKGTATASYLQFTAGTTTGQLATDGFEVGIDASGNAIISQQENLPLMVYTNSAERLRIAATGTATFSGAVSIGNDFGTALTIGRFSAGIPIAYIRASTSSTGGFRLTNHNGLDVIVVDGSNNITLDGPVTNITGKLGIGTTTIGTDFKLAVYGTNSLMAFQNANTGQTNGDGLIVGSFGNVDGYLFNYENANIIFGTNATERMRITSGGELRLGSSTNNITTGGFGSGGVYSEISGNSIDTKDYRIQVINNANNAYNNIRISGGTSVISFQTEGNERARITADGNILLGTTSNNGERLYISGNVRATGSITANSDITLKKNLLKIENALEKVEQINGYTYELKADDSKRHAGVIAQEIQTVLPEIVNTGNDGLMGVEYGNISALLIEAIKELKAEIETLKNK